MNAVDIFTIVVSIIAGIATVAVVTWAVSEHLKQKNTDRENREGFMFEMGYRHAMSGASIRAINELLSEWERAAYYEGYKAGAKEQVRIIVESYRSVQ